MARPSFPNSGTGTGLKASTDFAPPLLSSLVAALPGPLLVLDRADRVALASPAAEEIFGYEPGTLAAQDLRTLFPRGIAESPAQAARGDDQTRRIAISRREMSHEGGSLTLLWLEDVTEQRQSEESLKRNVQDLQQATRAKSEFVASMSHEIRTPMNAVLGMTDILLESDLDEEQRELAERVRRAGANLLTTLNGVLDLSKVEAGHLPFEPTLFGLRNWLHEALELFHTQAAAKNLTLDGIVEDDVPQMVHGDAPRLRQVLVNLIGNAVKFTPSGRVSVRVAAIPETNTLRFSVRDTGVGIEPEHLNRLFEAWSQAGPSMPGECDGTGLGLAIARRFVERMGGTIEASSLPGCGSEFRFSVPMEPKKSSHREPGPIPLHPEHLQRPHRRA
ncbi:MAG: ATP-binding protein [Candidatus Binatia bacterium]|nr:ATP-binding protein [Candidatus Binatia bacterium]